MKATTILPSVSLGRYVNIVYNPPNIVAIVDEGAEPTLNSAKSLLILSHIQSSCGRNQIKKTTNIMEL